MIRLSDALEAMDGWFPPGAAQPWDAVGLVCGDPREPVERILLAVDPVPAVVEQAERLDAQLIITHHPLLLSPVHGVSATTAKGALIHRLIRGGRALHVAHTNADAANPGVSDALAGRLGIDELSPLEPVAEPAGDRGGIVPGAAPSGPRGTGRIGRLGEPTTLRRFAARAAAALPATVWGIRAAGDPERRIERVAVCGGAGGSLIETARDAGADAYLTADLRHHVASEAVAERAGGAVAPMALIDAAHWATERPWLDQLAAALRARFGTTVSVAASDLSTDPWTLHATP